MIYQTLEESMNTKHPVIVVEEKDFDYKGNKRKWLTTKKQNGKKYYMVVQYENGMYSSPITY